MSYNTLLEMVQSESGSQVLTKNGIVWCNTSLLSQSLSSMTQEGRAVLADVSKSGLGAVLLQEHNGEWKPVIYASRAMTQVKVIMPK